MNEEGFLGGLRRHGPCDLQDNSTNAVLAIELALLASFSAMSANTSVFIVVYCSEVNAP